ncbi:MAG: hypothetical protein DRJ40_02365 [Thermoprotei archaeon]|nr:MAG: hypothetical protein DRJ40_02365 [Thermoprotei archaeon]
MPKVRYLKLTSFIVSVFGLSAITAVILHLEYYATIFGIVATALAVAILLTLYLRSRNLADVPEFIATAALVIAVILYLVTPGMVLPAVTLLFATASLISWWYFWRM